MKKMGIQPGEAAVDICSGTCEWTIGLAKAVGENGKTAALDFSQKMLEVGDAKLKAQGLREHVDLVQGDAMNLPFADNQFDYATIGFALRNVADIQRVLSEMKRVVKPGGKVVSLEVSKPPFWLYRKMFYFYFYRILPHLGKILTGMYDEYKWLPASLTNFPDSRKLARMFRDVGLDDVETHLFAGGASALHMGVKRG